MPEAVPILIPVEKISVSKLFIDTSYQRVPDPKRVMRIVANFDAHAFQVLEVSLRPNGRYAVFDGGHKFSAAKVIGFQELYCRVHTGLTVGDEAMYFNMLQVERKRLTQVEMFNADVVRGYEPAIRIKAIAEGEGYRIDEKANDGSLNFFKALYRADSLGVLQLQLRVMREAWGIQTGKRAVISSRFEKFTSFLAAIPHPVVESALIRVLGRNQYDSLSAYVRPNYLMDQYLDALAKTGMKKAA